MVARPGVQQDACRLNRRRAHDDDASLHLFGALRNPIDESDAGSFAVRSHKHMAGDSIRPQTDTELPHRLTQRRRRRGLSIRARTRPNENTASADNRPSERGLRAALELAFRVGQARNADILPVWNRG